MKKYKQLSSVLTVVLLSVFFISCKDSSEQSSEQISNAGTNSYHQQIDQQKMDQQRIDQQNEQLNIDKIKIQQQQEEQLKQAEQSRQYMLAINDLLEKDAEIGRVTGEDHSLTASEMRLLDISKCPSDFRAAYVDHIHAWEEVAAAQEAKKEIKKYTGLALVAEILKPITKSEAQPFHVINEAKRELDQMAYKGMVKIRDTWQTLEHIAVSYGAKLPSK